MKPMLLLLSATFIGVRSQNVQHFCSEDCVMSLADMTPESNGTYCNYKCTTGGGFISNPCTTTAVPTTTTTTEATTTTTTETTTETTTTTTQEPTTTEKTIIEGRCASIIKENNVTYSSKCVIIDSGATCSEDAAQPVCTCSVGYSGVTCQVADDQLEKIKELLGCGPDADAEAQKVLETIIASKGSGGSATMIVNLPALLSFLNDSMRIGMSYSVNEVIAFATYEGKPLDIDTEFTRITDPSLGNCFTFNHYNATTKYRRRRVGTEGGLRIELDSMPAEYAPWTDVVGMTVFVHTMGQDLNLESNKYASIAGSADQLVLKKSVFHRIPSKKCAKDKSAAQSFYLDGDYTVDGCYRACYQDSVEARCGCMDASYARKEGVDGCKFGKLSCIAAMVADRGDPVHWKECRCPQPCDEETYDYIVSRATHLRIDNVSLTQRRSEVVIFFDSFQTKISKEAYRISLSQVIGNIGGVAGLLLGITFSFIIEVIILCCILFCNACKNTSNHPEKKTMKSSSTFDG